MSEKNIYQRINKVMSQCDYLQKKEAQQGKGLRFDDLVAMLRALMITHGIVVVMRQLEMRNASGVEGTKQKIYEGKYELDLVNMDKPEEKVTHSVYAHGMDGGDKGPGKAHTYAAKAMLKVGFMVETGDDEESRAEKIDKQNLISSEQCDTLAQYLLCADNSGQPMWSPAGLKMGKAFNIARLDLLPASKYNEVLKRCQDYVSNNS